MKIGEIARPNRKGQVVIPKKFRDELGISENVPLHIVRRGHGIYLYPISDVISAGEKLDDDAYQRILKKTRGAWSGDNWEKTAKQQSQTEKRAVTKGKKAW